MARKEYATELEREQDKEIRGLNRTLISLRGQLNIQIHDYQEMAQALLSAIGFELGGVVRIVDEQALRKAYKIADRYFN